MVVPQGMSYAAIAGARAPPRSRADGKGEELYFTQRCLLPGPELCMLTASQPLPPPGVPAVYGLYGAFLPVMVRWGVCGWAWGATCVWAGGWQQMAGGD